VPYPTRRDFSWLIDRDGAPPSPLPLLQDADDISLPREVDDKISPVFDAYGWDRAQQAQASTNTSGLNAVLVATAPVPAGRLRYIFDASIQTSSAVGAFWLSMEHRIAVNVLDVGLMIPFLVPALFANVKVSPGRSVILAPFDTLRGLSNVAVGVGDTLTIRTRFVDIPFGEYIPPR